MKHNVSIAVCLVAVFCVAWVAHNHPEYWGRQPPQPEVGPATPRYLVLQTSDPEVLYNLLNHPALKDYELVTGAGGLGGSTWPMHKKEVE